MEVLTKRRRLRQVNRAFRDAILLSPSIQHKINLYAVGFEYNPAAGIDIAESRKALHQYLSNLDSLCPIEERSVEKLRVEEHGIDRVRAAGGAIVIVDEPVRLLALGSSTRRGDPASAHRIRNYGFYPGADVSAFVEMEDAMYVYLLLELLLRAHIDMTELRRSSFI